MGAGAGGHGGLAPVALLAGGSTVARERLPRTPASVGAVRLLVDDVLAEHGVTDRSVVDAAVLLASELATDGVRHGQGEDLAVEVAIGPRRVQLTVTSAADSAPGSHHDDVAGHSRQLLDMIAGGWDVRVSTGTRTSWYRLERYA